MVLCRESAVGPNVCADYSSSSSRVSSVELSNNECAVHVDDREYRKELQQQIQRDVRQTTTAALACVVKQRIRSRSCPPATKS